MRPRSEEEEERIHEHVQQFAKEFAQLVRKFAPTYDPNLVAMMQDMTSCFSPYVWSDEFNPKEPT